MQPLLHAGFQRPPHAIVRDFSKCSTIEARSGLARTAGEQGGRGPLTYVVAPEGARSEPEPRTVSCACTSWRLCPIASLGVR